MRSRLPSLLALTTLGLVLGGCGSGSNLGQSSSKEPLRFGSFGTLPAGYTGEFYNAPVGLAGGVNPYSLRLVGGKLPPGVSLTGSSLSGTPTAKGRYEFTLEASDASLSVTTRTFAVNVDEIPPMALQPVFAKGLTAGEFRSETRVPLKVDYPRGTRAARFQWKLPEGASVTRVTGADVSPLMLWKQNGALLTLDLGFPNQPKTGQNVVLIGMQFDRAVKLDVAQTAFEARDGEGKLVAERKFPEEPKPGDPKTVDPKTGLPVAPDGTPAADPNAPAAPTPPADPNAPATPTPPADPNAPATPTPPATPAPTPPTDPATPTPPPPATPAPAPTPPATPAPPPPAPPAPTPPAPPTPPAGGSK